VFNCWPLQLQIDGEVNILRGERDQAKDIIDDLSKKLNAVNAVIDEYQAERQVCAWPAGMPVRVVICFRTKSKCEVNNVEEVQEALRTQIATITTNYIPSLEGMEYSLNDITQGIDSALHPLLSIGQHLSGTYQLLCPA